MRMVEGFFFARCTRIATMQAILAQMRGVAGETAKQLPSALREWWDQFPMALKPGGINS